MHALIRLYSGFDRALGTIAPLADLAIRCYVSWVFFKSGLLKIQSWESTLTLFEYEYAVPLLSPHLAAVLGTAAELGLPVLVALGLLGRPAAFALFVFNIVAVISYPDLSDGGKQFHVLWGLLLAVTMTHGSGCLSLDALIRRLRGTAPC
ncbi:MAG: DoxX family protein [Thiobacillus sp.]|nr:DoxX family protein [Thiobacillus sp.]MDP1925216.1 DoxX family protein [Thiobacillus sp.]